MDLKTKTVGKVDLDASPGAEGWKDVLQLLKEQNVKMERLARALSIIQQGMLRNNPRHVTDSVNEATEMFGGMLNTHKCLLESGVKIQKKIESHPAMKKLGIFQRPRSASLGDTSKNQAKGEKRSAPTPPLEKTAKRGKGGSSPSYAQVATSQAPNKEGDWHVVTKKRKKKRKRRRTLCKKHRGLPPSSSRSAARPPDPATPSWCQRRTARPGVSGLQQPRQEEFLLEMRNRGSHGRELQGNAEVPDVSRQGR